MRLQAGQTFAGYRVLKQLGRGGMAYVYLVEEPGIDRRVALKLLPEEVVGDPNAEARFEQEARTVAALEHPHIVPLYRHGIERGAPWMALRFVEGGDLAERLMRPLAIPEGLQIFRQIAAALDFAHQKQVVHRDLKPQNVLLSREGHVYLADFGIAKLLAGGGLRTGTGGILGTPQYMAPEYARGEVPGPSADIYALGVMAFQWQTGCLPFDADTPQAVLFKQVLEPLPEAPMQALPPPLLAVLRQVLDKDPAQRPPTAGAFVEALAAALGTAAVAPLPPPVTPPDPVRRTPQPPTVPPQRVERASVPPAVPTPSSGPSRSLWPIAAAVTVALAAAGGTAWWMLRSTPERAAVTGTLPPAIPAANPATGSVLMVYTDAPCQLRVNGTDHGELQPGAPRRLEVPAGEQAVECVAAEWPDQNHRQTKAVAAGQQAVVEFALGESEAAPAADPVSGVSFLELPPPRFNDPVRSAPAKGPLGPARSAQPSPSMHAEDWFGTHQLTLRTIAGPTSPMPVPSWNGGFRIPDFVPEQIEGVKLLKVIDSGEAILSLYGPDFSSATRLLAQHPDTGAVLYALNFAAWVQAPQRIDADRDFVNQQIVWAQQLDGVLYVSHGHNTYARSSYGHNAYVSALDIHAGFSVHWHSPAQVSNAGNFLILGDHLISGYGFTAEPDFLYVLDRQTGTVLQRTPLKSGPDYILANDRALHVRTYDTDYEFPLPGAR
ncbi:MAG: serine/threonine protein kinase [Xanthomonadales bacterium]|jgi:serine/threonine-protein kinase|nr:serine/threonine protein kinase [Xanthomonadales bacterium]